MSISAEVRWFWLGPQPPGDLEEWFRDSACFPHPLVSPEPRVDVYLLDPWQVELGLKRRDVKGNEEQEEKELAIEVKGLFEERQTPIEVGPLTGRAQIWKKWKSKALTSASLDAGARGTIKTQKVRWLRKFTTLGPRPAEVQLDEKFNPADGSFLAQGCGVELTQVTLPGAEVWWSFGLEAFGPPGAVEENLRAVAKVLTERPPAGVEAGEEASYPAWLRRHGCKTRG
jgi:hypothetical protein